MKRHRVLLIAVIVVSALALSFWTLAVAQGPSDSQPGGATPHPAQDAGSLGSDSNPTGSPEVFIPEHYRPSAAGVASVAAATTAATVYFAPQDENTSTTVLFLYNTGTTTATVGLQTYEPDGLEYINTTVAVPPAGLVRICADEVSTVSWTWQDVVLINFTTASAYAKMTLPAGVKAEGYVVWNNATTYDPLQVAPTLPLRFSTDPSTVFLPSVQHD